MSAGGEYAAGEYTGRMPDIEQEEPESVPMPPIPVDVCGAVRVQHVPSRRWASMSRLVTATEPVKLTRADPRRRCLTIISAGDSVYVGGDQASCLQRVAALWPAGVPLKLTHQDEVWVVTETTDATVSFAEELWAD